MAGVNLLDAVRARPVSKGIGTADYYLRQFEQCLGGSCPSKYFDGLSEFRWKKGVEAASKQLVYHHPDMGVDGGFELDLQKAAAAVGIDIPKHTIATFPAIITTTRQDRDGDILETAGADLDLKAPLLYQHMPFENIGRLLLPGKHTKKSLAGTFSICGTALGEDAAMLAEHGALRISHGFIATKWEPLEDESGMHVLEFKVLEVSLVSIPSNPDAELTAFSREKLKSPVAKALAEFKFKNRPIISPASIDVAALANSLPAGTSVTFSKSADQVQPAALPEAKSACGCHNKNKAVTSMDGIKSVVPYKETPASKSDSWDADEAVKGLRSWSGVDGDEPSAESLSKYKQGFGIVDGESDNLTSYKYPHHEASDGKLTVNRKALGAVVAALNGGRGGSKLSESDRKGLYNHIKKHYRDAFPDDDVPELKAVAPLRYKGVYVEFENSFDDIRCDLNDSLLSYLIATGEADSQDFCYIVDLFLYQALVQVCPQPYYYDSPYPYYGGDESCYYLLDWEMGADEEPVWSGAPQAIEITPQITALDKRARSMFIKSLPAKHVRAMKKAMGHMDSVMGADDSSKAVTDLAKKAHTAIKSVHDEHAKASGMSADCYKSLKSAMGYCDKGAEHDDATDAQVKSFKAAKVLVKDVMDDTDSMSGEESLESLIQKAGRKLSAANQAKVKAAASYYKAIANDDEAHKDVAELAGKGYGAVRSIFATGGDAGDDMLAYTVDGESGGDAGKSIEPDGEKAGRAVSKETEAKIRESIGHGEEIVGHEKATDDHKGLARRAVKKLKAVLGESSNPNDADPDGGMGLNVEQPSGSEPLKTLRELCAKSLFKATIEYNFSGDDTQLKEVAGIAAEFAKQSSDTTAKIDSQRRFETEEALVSQAAV